MGKNQVRSQGKPAKRKGGQPAIPVESIAIFIALYAFSRLARRDRC
jgi:hypothetical protein